MTYGELRMTWRLDIFTVRTLSIEIKYKILRPTRSIYYICFYLCAHFKEYQEDMWFRCGLTKNITLRCWVVINFNRYIWKKEMYFMRTSDSSPKAWQQFHLKIFFSAGPSVTFFGITNRQLEACESGDKMADILRLCWILLLVSKKV